LSVHNGSDVRQVEIDTAEPLVPDTSHLEVEITIAKLKKYKSPDSDLIPAELIQARGETVVSVIHKLINSSSNKDELTVTIIVAYHCYQLHTKFDCISFFHG
jgi:hypothetical protein